MSKRIKGILSYPDHAPHAKYEHANIAILNDRLDVIGNITFQGTISERGSIPVGKYWYGITFNISTNKVDFISEMLSVCKKISKLYLTQPEEIIEALNIERYMHWSYQIIPESYKGMVVAPVRRNGALERFLYGKNTGDLAKQFASLRAKTASPSEYALSISELTSVTNNSGIIKTN